MPNFLSEIARVVRDLFDASDIVFARSDQTQIGNTHVFHGADDCANVDGVLRLVQHDGDGGKQRFRTWCERYLTGSAVRQRSEVTHYGESL